jgi:hypothetical protein
VTAPSSRESGANQINGGQRWRRHGGACARDQDAVGCGQRLQAGSESSKLRRPLRAPARHLRDQRRRPARWRSRHAPAVVPRRGCRSWHRAVFRTSSTSMVSQALAAMPAGEDGSPTIAVKSALEHAARIKGNILFLFVEEKPDRAAVLQVGGCLAQANGNSSSINSTIWLGTTLGIAQAS